MTPRIILIAFFLFGALFFAHQRETEITILWIGLFNAQLILFAIDIIKQHIDKTFKSN